jgi:hypothetical protein
MPVKKPYNKNQPARRQSHRQLVDRVRNLEDQIDHLLVRIERLERPESIGGGNHPAPDHIFLLPKRGV